MNPYAAVSVDRLWQLLRRARLGSKEPLCSNFAYAVLGQLLATAYGTDYATALRQRLLVPYGMSSSTAEPPGAEPAARRGHDRLGWPTRPLDFGAFAPAGGIRASPQDVGAWLAVHCDPTSPLGDAARLATSRGASASMGLGWMLGSDALGEYAWHNGATGGFSAFAAVDRQRRVAVAALAASAHTPSFDAASMALFADERARL
jgi:CubicO group peptidase (beta-lactamase class C family)